MSQTLALYDYQEECQQALTEARKEYRSIAVVMATGLGKTVCLINDIRQAGKRAAIVVHRDELADQTVRAAKELAPELSVGMIKAEHNDLHADITILSIQTLARDDRLSAIDPWHFGSIHVDECHHVMSPTYLRVLSYFGAADYVTGWTATFGRSDGKNLAKVFEHIAFDRDILFGIESGRLRDVKGVSVTLDGMSLDQVARNKSDYVDGSLSEMFMAIDAGPKMADAILEHGRHPLGPNGLRQMISFCPSVESARYFEQSFNDAGVNTRTVIGETPREERKEIYQAIRDGELQNITSVGVLTEGFDLPPISMGLMLRPTTSPHLYRQMAGRILRIDRRPKMMFGPDLGPIPDAILLDPVGVGTRHSLVGVNALSKVRARDGESLREADLRELKELSEQDENARIAYAELVKDIDGSVAYEEIDLFHRSARAWQQTRRGVWFIAARGRTWFLWPAKVSEDGEERWRVGVFFGSSTKGGTWPHPSLPLEYAMALAEKDATEFDPSIANRSAPWRAKKEKPSAGQLGMARGLKIDPSGLTKAELSDKITVAAVSRILDPLVKKGRQ